ncbi:sensor histidine kinase [Emticicia sp. TH156]|uniref:sensor histidine kinase n=1 Tax=Emticicia sp. TH156 TaxID=2067454 RepID=UPI000C75ACB4|nr:ATP-binding protein [Emticicia sp. TH156]PLK45080.1 histidine kinase [Emticicia sp. TH156]
MKFEFSDLAQKTLFTFLVFRFLRTYYDTAKKFPEQDILLKRGWLYVIPFLIVSQFPWLRFFKNYFFEIFVLAGAFFIYRARYNRSTNVLWTAVFPLATVIVFMGLLRLIVPSFFNEYAELFDIAKGFAVCWMIGFGFYAHKQNKVELQQRQKAEEERLRNEAKKQELEYQVAQRTAELLKQKEALEETVEELISTQKQLVQAEKMASLGELTAGIAHEIQNPLNFVNNFSELSVELAKELQEELERDEQDKDLIADLVSDLVQNQEKINHHGKRAASIVRGMLQHSRASTGQKEETDINDLADEYLRLSYHGLRAKDKTFNADFKTYLDPDVPKVNIIPQDFGRVLLNLFNNGFYAVQEKARQNLNGYKPTLEVITQMNKKDNEITIRVKDNGTGIPESVRNKIFQPFFTTKPTGQGTGLGLSLAFDIISKGHGGTLDVTSVEGEGTEFLITIPVG